MKKFLKWTATFLLLAAAFWLGSVYTDHKSLQNDLIRLHVVANSDSKEDQALKLQVRDAVTDYLKVAMNELPNAEQAKAFLMEHLGELETYVNDTIKDLGFSDKAVVSLGKEQFGIREYDSFSLPSGVYESLRITIGEGEGKNWWCVVFPQLCLSAASSEFTDTAVDSGLSQSLSGALDHSKGYEVRFLFLDIMGRIENFFFR